MRSKMSAVAILALLVGGCKEKCGCHPTLPPPPPGQYSIHVSPDQLAMHVGGSFRFSVDVEVPSGKPTSVTWSTPNSSTISVDEGGNVLAKAVGTARVIATLVANPNKSDTATVIVSAPPEPGRIRGIAIIPTSKSIRVGEKFTPTPVVTADPGVSTDWTCSSSNASVAIVNPETCEIKGIFPGPLNGQSPIQIIATSVAVHPTLGKLQAGMQLFVRP